jgi:ABC-2 type transport system ATP-binding protein
MKIIEVQNLVKQYKKSTIRAVDDISFYVDKGAFFSLLGPNGAGKTTAISILTTTLAKTSGTVTVAEYDLDTQSAQIRRNIGVIFQNPSLDMNLTAEENIRIHAILYNLYPFRPTFSMMPKAYKDRVQELAAVLGISKDIHKPIKTFSGGMKRKLEIIRSLMHKPKVLFLDEPTTGLDPLSRKSLWQYLQEVREQEKTTIFLTTHYLEEAEGSDYVCVMGNGKIVSQGTPRDIKKDLIDEYLLVEADDVVELIKELDTKKLHFSEISKDATGSARIKVDLGKKTVQQVIQSIKTPLTELHVHSPTLEEAYLEIVAKSQEDQHESQA